MKIALCLSGLIGNAEKWLNGAPLDYQYGYKYLKDSILDCGDVETFIHSYSTEHQEGLEDLYKPVKSVFEPNPDFKLRGSVTKEELPSPYAYCLKSMWYSRKRSVELVLEYEEENNFKYDLVLLTRFDIALFKKFEFEKYNTSKMYIAGPIVGQRLTTGQVVPYKINDMYFMAKSDLLYDVTKVFDTYEAISMSLNPKWPLESVSSHMVITQHLLKLGLFQHIECLFERPWQSSRDWSGDIRFLRSDPNIKLLLDK